MNRITDGQTEPGPLRTDHRRAFGSHEAWAPAASCSGARGRPRSEADFPFTETPQRSEESNV